ncbi:hypothetical protein TNCV_3244861 [Trichonephila clavipes]|nr:hypothetical protein TNCV_3244861 [Trichonephila clavipes]
MSPLLHGNNETAVTAVGGSRWFSAEENEVDPDHARKVMTCVFWDAKVILLINYLEKGSTITGEYYCKLFDLMDDTIREKRPGLKKIEITFHQDNARLRVGDGKIAGFGV